MFCRQTVFKWTCHPMTRWLVCFAILFSSNNDLLRAQTEISDNAPKNRGLAFGLSVGSQALLGADLTYRLNDWLEVRGGYNYLQLSVSNLEVNAADLGFADQTVLVDADVNLSTMGVILGFSPGAKNVLRFMGGALIGLNNSIATTIHFKDRFRLNDYELEPGRVGEIAGVYTTSSSVFPYAGIGVGRSIPRRRVGISLEAGAYYRGAPSIDISGSGLLADNAHNGPVLEQNLASLKWHPNVSFRLAYRLSSNDGRSSDGYDQNLLHSSPVTTYERIGKNDGEAVAETAEDNPADQYPYVIFEGRTFSENANTPLDHVYLNVYELKKESTKELVRTGRFPGGSFTVGLERGRTYEFSFEHTDFHPMVKTIAVDAAWKDKAMQESFLLKPID